MPHETITVDTAHGRVSGIAEAEFARFQGIPYAAPPTGPNRFGAPVPPRPWSGVLPAHGFGPPAPRPVGGSFDEILSGLDPVPGDGWLNLNVWTPDVTGSSPVLVWIHGGAFLRGSSAGTMYDGAAFAEAGVVLVSFNYRLGVEGFGYVADAPVPANRGLLDQIAALEWVRDNIAGFGGDPDNVTVFGESAGAMSILTLLSLDLGLFHRAIAQSGSAHVVQTAADAALVTGEIALALGVPPTAEGLSGVDTADLVAAQTLVHNLVVGTADAGKYGESTIQTCGMSLVPVVDGDLVRVRPIDAIAAGAGQDVPLVIGTTTEEHRYFVLSQSWEGLPVGAWVQRLAAYGVPDPARFYDQYAEGTTARYPRDTPAEVFSAVMTDRLFRIPSLRVAEARKGHAPTYVYDFGWRTPVPSVGGGALGACHVVELPFVWHTLGASGVDELVADGPVPLADEVNGRWVEFAATGSLESWDEYGDERPVMVFHAERSAVVPDPRGAERALWDGALDPE
ncbi:carboxylesterase family protein [Actinosynnema sp. NPDC047251]|uniref:Carboxylic ester hydrolase n=1 Tax=Saccharothrix espanaensis (strain ATCC 51144 / DSM 44229 / JCM 9112 / NBRC 15066 / NRRL 15764) TaxID=1179773 RepID=K0JYD8_SACES|nr:carboxylesterase family protein [Saccharothrix espanaensis]CCH31136.1 Carboxylesterase [Saccharothrix espanaensis DSM 44229]